MQAKEIEGYPVPGVTALSVNSSDEDAAQIESIFRRCRWTLRSSSNVNSALISLRRNHLPVVLCDAGNWKEILERSRDLPEPPLVIVTSRHADEYLWAEALNLGAYDVLPTPFDTNEVVRVVSLAWLRGQNRPAALPATKAMVA